MISNLFYSFTIPQIIQRKLIEERTQEKRACDFNRVCTRTSLIKDLCYVTRYPLATKIRIQTSLPTGQFSYCAVNDLLLRTV